MPRCDAITPEGLTPSQLEEWYWNGVANHVVPPDEKVLTQNYWKIPTLLRHVLKYDFFHKKIVEIGCGPGMIAGLIHLSHGGMVDYIGTDISANFIRAAKEIFDLNVVMARPYALPAKDKEVDYIFAFDVLEHIRHEERPAVAQEFDRVLKNKTGRVLINNPLSASNHDDRFDFTFTDVEMAEFTQNANLYIESVKVYTQRKRYYQFIVLGRERP